MKRETSCTAGERGVMPAARLRRICRYSLFMTLCIGILPANAVAWYGGPYPGWQYPYPPNYGGWPGYAPYAYGYTPYGYAEPRWYFRGRMNQYGDYYFVLRMRNININDLYNAWLWYQDYR
ncbi:MAG: hypothetical protein GC149_14630 [Gammaproteobacteria bacterium]|nr:hypothetical protein [Gammaproteobacteria bacterium]